MKGVWNIMVLLVASFMLTGVAVAQDKYTPFERGISADSDSSLAAELNMEPQLVLGTDTRISGLMVDCLTTGYLSVMFNPALPLRNVPGELPPYLLPVKAPHPINDPAAHEPDFALFRLSFP